MGEETQRWQLGPFCSHHKGMSSPETNPPTVPAEAQITVCVPSFYMKCGYNNRSQVSPEGALLDIYNRLINT